MTTAAFNGRPQGGGLTSDPSATLEQLFNRLVMRYEKKMPQARREDGDVWRTYKRTLESRHVLKHLQTKKIAGPDEEVEFPYAWKNGTWHCLQPLSFDLASAEGIRDKAHKLLGSMMSVKDTSEPFKLYLLLGEPQNEALRPAFSQAMNNLARLMPVEREFVYESGAQAFAESFATKLSMQDASSDVDKNA